MKPKANFGPWIMAALAGVLLTASFPPVDVAPLAWLALWPLLAAVRDRAFVARLALGALAGIVWAGGTVFLWLYPAARTHLASSPPAAALLAATATWVYGGMYLCALAAVYPRLPRPRWLMAPAAWVLLEVVRTHALGGAPWALLGHSQHGLLPLAQLAELTGVAGLSFLVLMPAAALAERGRERRVGLVVWGLAMIAVSAFGLARLARYDTATAPPGAATIVVVSGHHGAAEPLAAYAAATSAVPPASLTIWPETAFFGYLDEAPAAAGLVTATARARGWLLLGTLGYEGRGAARRYRNLAQLVGPDGRTRATYAKARLVPFAERAPWPFPSVVARPFTPGDSTQAPLAAGDLRLGVLICWEAIFPGLARAYARRGADVLVNLTSDLDLGAGAVQLLAFARFRAIETRRWLVRASGTGTTHLIDPAGRVYERARLAIAVNDTTPPGLFVRAPALVPGLALGVLALGYAIGGVRTRGRTSVRTRGRGRARA